MLIKSLIFLAIFFLSLGKSFAKVHDVALSQKVEFHSGDIINLTGSEFSVKIGSDPGTECAVPGFNCGSGYQPPSPTFTINCGKQARCLYVLMAYSKTATSGSLSVEDEKSCEKNDPANCFNEFARKLKNDGGCMELVSPSGRYYCLKRFETSAKPENRGLCEQLPESVYALRWNCFYEHAIRYRDASFCDKYPSNETSGRDRCLLKMAELLKEPSHCKKISASKEHSYKEQCLNLKLRN